VSGAPVTLTITLPPEATLNEARFVATVLTNEDARWQDTIKALNLLDGSTTEVARTDRDVALAWVDYRNNCGVSAGNLAAAHEAFMAGWQARAGALDAGGVQR